MSKVHVENEKVAGSAPHLGTDSTCHSPTNTNEIGWSFLYSKRWIGYFVLIIIFSIACVWLANWQFERRAEARAEISRIDSNYDADPVLLAEAMPDLSQFDDDEMKWQPVIVTGTYVGEPFLARNRPGADGVGSHLIQPIRLTSGKLFFVDRGWVPVTGADQIPEDLPRPETGVVEVTARLRASEPDISGRSSTERSVASINLAELSELSGESENVYTAGYGQLIAESPASETGASFTKPLRDEGPHLSYALQWYVFILIALIGVAYAARKEYRSLNDGNESVLREDARSEDRRQRKGPTDADEEDALLDG